MGELHLITSEAVADAVTRHLPGCAIHSIEDRGVWGRHHFKVTLGDGDIVWVKVQFHTEWSAGTEKEAFISQLFASHDLPAPCILAVDTSGEVIARPYLIETHLPGTRLSALLGQVDGINQAGIYRTIGACYRRLHAIRAERSGWIDGPGRVMPVSPNDHMHQAAIVETGQRAVEAGLLGAAVYQRMVNVAERHLETLKEHTPALIHGNAFPWAIHLETASTDTDGEASWRVSRLMDLSDVLYWDPAYDLASLKYPPFGEENGAHWQAFSEGYGLIPPERRLLLYLLIQRVQAGMGDYMEPPAPGNLAWRRRALQEIPEILDRIEGAGA